MMYKYFTQLFRKMSQMKNFLYGFAGNVGIFYERALFSKTPAPEVI